MFIAIAPQFLYRASRFVKLALGMGLAGLVAACGGPGTSSVSNPNYVLAKMDKRTQVMSGQYNPAGYSGGQVKTLVALTCAGKRVASFSESMQSGLVTFAATCDGGFEPRYALVTFEKLAARKVLVEATGSDGAGNIIFTQYEAELGPRGVRQVAATPQAAAPQAASESAESAETRTVEKAPKPSDRCRNSITIYCKDSSSGAVIPNVSPEDS